MRVGRAEVNRQESGGARRAMAVVGSRDEEEMRAAALAPGPVGVAVGSPGSPQGAAPRQGPESSRDSPRAGTAVDGASGRRADTDRPQQHDSPRHRVAHLQCRAWASASNVGVAIESPRANSPRPKSATAIASSRLHRTDRKYRGWVFIPGVSCDGTPPGRVLPRVIRSDSWSNPDEPLSRGRHDRGYPRIRRARAIRPVAVSGTPGNLPRHDWP